MTETTKTLYAYRPKNNSSFMIVCDSQESAAFVTKGWFYFVMGSRPPYDDAKMEKELDKWELITLEVEEDD